MIILRFESPVGGFAFDTLDDANDFAKEVDRAIKRRGAKFMPDFSLSEYPEDDENEKP